MTGASDGSLPPAVCTALFNDDSYRWLLAANGLIVERNDTAATLGGSQRASVWSDGDWWDEADRDRLAEAIQRVVDRPETGRPTTTIEASMIVPSDDGESRSNDPAETNQMIPVEVQVEAIGPDRLLATAEDIGERAQLADRLRRSEELHRVTLNNMTDTVLVTDADGEFTYICPNVQFIFGYTVEEIEAFGTVDKLLGERLFDPDRLDEKGVLTNIETTTTDAFGHEHTLLINVKRVDIQGGTTLYSCRDITTRKRRETAVSVVHDTAKQLLYAGTREEIASLTIDGIDRVPGFDAAIMYRYDGETNKLVPSSHTDAATASFGQVTPVAIGDNELSRAFLDAELRTGSILSAAGTQVCVPMDEHGVLVVDPSDSEPMAAAEGATDIAIEIAELFAATVEAAFDRVTREERLREHDRTLQSRNERLERMNEINTLIRSVDRDLVTAESRSAIERAVCEQLTADRFAFAWIGSSVGEGALEPRAWAGSPGAYLDAIEGDPNEPGTEAHRRGEPMAIDNVAAEPRGAAWRRTALTYGYQSVASVPLTVDGVTHGVLTVYAASPDAFNGEIFEVLTELGHTVAAAISAVARKAALVGDGATETVRRYETDAPAGFVGRVAAELETTISVVGMDADGRTLFIDAASVPAERARQVIVDRSGVEDVTIVSERDTTVSLRVRFQSGTEFLPAALADHGVRVERFTSDAEQTTLIVAVGEPTGVTAVNAIVNTHLPNARLVTQTKRSGAVDNDRTQPSLTDKQREAVRTAYHAGYFEIPRACSGEDVATALDISPQAFYQRLRGAQKRQYKAMFDRSVQDV